MPAGTVKWFNKEKGFGFIAPDDGGRDVYFESANIETPDRSLMDGQRVEFEMSMGRKGPQASKIKSLG